MQYILWLLRCFIVLCLILMMIVFSGILWVLGDNQVFKAGDANDLIDFKARCKPPWKE